MVRVKVEVTDGTVAFTAAVCAANIRQAVRIAEDSYPGSAVGVVFPIVPEDFFVEEREALGAGFGK
jgi:hypothetical protein